MGDSQPGEIDSLSDGAEQSSGSRRVQASTLPTAESLNSLTVAQLKERAAGEGFMLSAKTKAELIAEYLQCVQNGHTGGNDNA